MDPAPNEEDIESNSPHESFKSMDPTPSEEDIESNSQHECQDESVGENVNTQVEGEQEEDYRVQLYRAALSGKWEAAREIFRNHNNCYTEIISRNGDTALHIAAAGGRSNFVKKLLRQSSLATAEQLLESKNKFDNTAFCLAAASGALDIVQEMQRMKNDLPNIAGNRGMKPILMAALRGQANIVTHLMGCSIDFSDEYEGIDLLVSAINTNMYGVALDILDKKKDLAHTSNGDGDTPLHVLARKTPTKRAGRLNIVTAWKQKDDAKRKLVKRLWKIIVAKQQPELISDLVSHPRPIGLLFVALELGNCEFVLILIRHYPDLIWEEDDEGRTIFHAAVEYRQEKIYRHIYEIAGINQLLAVKVTQTHGYNILHLAARLPSLHRLNVVSGPALQMQRELLWFQEVEGFIQYGFVDSRNAPLGSSDEPKEIPRVMFTREHVSLRKEGEKWMRDTSRSCMIVATLVAAVVFQAIFQPPSKENAKLYRMFVISDAISVVSSTASILTFLAILTSRYAEEDFLISLPLKLIIGLLLLFVSLMTMLLAFTATIAINFQPRSFTITIAVLAGITGSLYILQHHRLLADVCRSTFRSDCLFRHRRRLL